MDINRLIELELEKTTARLLAGFYSRLDKAGLNRSLLRQEISPGAPTVVITETNGRFIYSLSLPDYYKYIDRGVKGVEQTPPGAADSPYKYKSRFPNRKMAASIGKWVTSKGVSIYDSGAQKKVRGIKDKGTRQLTIQKLKERRSYQIAASVKKKGIRGTKFFTDTATPDVFQDLADGIAAALGKRILVEFKLVS